jgi:hypothetical protein
MTTDLQPATTTTVIDTGESVRVHGTFFKYRAFPDKSDTGRWNQLEAVLTNLEGYFAGPSTLNDPFDCYPRVGLHGEPEEIRRKTTAFLLEDAARRGRCLTEADQRGDDFQQCVSEQIEQFKDERFRTEHLFNAINAHTGIFCMSRCPDSILQWGYYGGGHAGFCLQFSIPQGAAPPFDQVVGIEYVPDRQSIDLFDLIGPNSQDFLWRMVRRKFDRWKHEEEVRAFLPKPGLRQFAAEFLTGIIFGAKASDDKQRWVRERLAKSAPHVRYYRAVPSFTHFELKVERLE